MQELAATIQDAKDGVIGSHYGLAYILRGFKITPSKDRAEIVKQAEQLLDRLTAEKAE
jgi:hypothetical protein